MNPIRCSDCEHIGGHLWGLPYDENHCKKIKERQAYFDTLLKAHPMDPIDAFRFRPTDGVKPSQYVGKCKFFAHKSN